MTPEEEKHALELIRKDQKHFSLFFDAYYKPIFGYTYRRTADYYLSRDIAADTFLKAFLKINSFKWKNISVLSWLYRIATNEINQYYRKLSYRPDMEAYILGNSPFERQASQDDEEERERLETELQEHKEFLSIQKALQTLSTRYQDVIALRYFENASIKEIARILDKKEGTIKSLLFRGIEILKEKVNAT